MTLSPATPLPLHGDPSVPVDLSWLDDDEEEEDVVVVEPEPEEEEAGEEEEGWWMYTEEEECLRQMQLEALMSYFPTCSVEW